MGRSGGKWSAWADEADKADAASADMLCAGPVDGCLCLYATRCLQHARCMWDAMCWAPWTATPAEPCAACNCDAAHTGGQPGNCIGHALYHVHAVISAWFTPDRLTRSSPLLAATTPTAPEPSCIRVFPPDHSRGSVSVNLMGQPRAPCAVAFRQGLR